MKITTPIVCATLLIASHLSNAADVASSNWPAWRGPLANGTAPESSPPTEWSDTKNVKWKVKLPGHGSATPAIWGDKLFILAAVGPEKKAEVKPVEPPPVVVNSATNSSGTNAPGDARRRRGGGMGRSEKPTDKFQFTVMCLDRKSGKTLWQKIAKEEVPHEGHHQDHGFASASPITDGKVVLAFFGSRGLYCYDMEGNLKWSKEFGQMRMRGTFGEAASPALRGDVVIVNWDHEGDDFIAALDKNTGKELWRTPRDEESSWGTPLIVDFKGQQQVIVGATMKVRSYDIATGKQLWQCGGQTANMIPTSVADADTVYAISGFRGASVQAITLGRTGDLTGTDAVRWSHDKNTPYVPSPVLAGNRLYFLSSRGAALSCFDTRTGKAHFEAQSLPGVMNAYASPVASKDRVYVSSREGKCVVLKQSDTLEILATNSIGEGTDASIAIVGNELFLRGKENLYCISEK
jgi:outer membrane protein assembly factor BamB